MVKLKLKKEENYSAFLGPIEYKKIKEDNDN